jgi:hypothetical protein
VRGRYSYQLLFFPNIKENFYIALIWKCCHFFTFEYFYKYFKLVGEMFAIKCFKKVRNGKNIILYANHGLRGIMDRWLWSHYKQEFETWIHTSFYGFLFTKEIFDRLLHPFIVQILGLKSLIFDDWHLNYWVIGWEGNISVFPRL